MSTAQYNVDGIRTMKLAAATTQHIRVTIDSAGDAAIAADTVRGIGTTLAAGATGDRVAIRLFTAPGTHCMKAAAAIVRGAPVFAAANGMVDDTGTVPMGESFNTAAALNDLVEIAITPQT